MSLLHTRPDRPSGPRSLMYNVYTGPFPVIRRPRRGIDHSSHGMLREDLYLYSTQKKVHFAQSWLLRGRGWPLLQRRPIYYLITQNIFWFRGGGGWGGGRSFISSAKHLDQLWGPPSLLHNGSGGIFPSDTSGKGVKLTTHLHRVPKLRIHGHKPPLPIRLHGVHQEKFT
jgi:hypothetical protein